MDTRAAIEQKKWGWVLLFTSMGTLLCCALPITLVALGFGAVSAALFANLPFLAVLAHHKLWLFVISAAFLVLAAWALYRPGRACPTDPELAAQCARADRWNRRLFMISAGFWGIGFSAAYLALPLMGLYDRVFGG